MASIVQLCGSGLTLAAEDLSWEDADVVIEVTHVKSLGGASSLTWNGEPVPLQPGTTGQRAGVHAPVVARETGANEFDIALDIKGAEAIWFVPFGRTTDVTLASNWPHPSFGGASFPTTREVADEGFAAAWQVPFLGGDCRQAWLGSDDPYDDIAASRFGVLFNTPVDYYRMSERSTKYAPLVLLFYLLELSLSEVIGFAGAYAAAAASVTGLIAAYTIAVMRSVARGAIVGGSLGLLYAYLLALLTLERYALLAGSLGLFAALAAVMYVARRVDWDRVAPGRQV